MQYISKYGELMVLAQLLEQGIEAYLAIKPDQTSYDITAIMNNNKVIRIQVKTRNINNRSTNNSISKIHQDYDFLVIVAVNDKKTEFFVLSRSEAIRAMGSNKELSISRKEKDQYRVTDKISCYKDKWEKIQ